MGWRKGVLDGVQKSCILTEIDSYDLGIIDGLKKPSNDRVMQKNS